MTGRTLLGQDLRDLALHGRLYEFMMRWLDNCNNRINFPLQIEHKSQAIEIKPIQYRVPQFIKDLCVNN